MSEIRDMQRGSAWRQLNDHLNSDLLQLLLLLGFTFISAGLLLPILPLYIREIGIGVTQVGILFAVGSLAVALSDLTCGWLVDRIDIRILLVAGTLLYGLSIAGFLFFQASVGLSIIFFLLGYMRVTTYISARWYVGTRIPPHLKAMIMSLLIVVVSASQSLASFFSGVVVDTWGYRTSLGVAASIPLCAGIFLLLRWQAFDVSNSAPPQTDKVSSGWNVGREGKWSNHLIPILGLATLCQFGCVGIILTYLPLIAGETMGLAATEVGVLFGVHGVVRVLSGVPLGLLADRRGKGYLILVSLLLMCVSITGIGLAREFPMILSMTVVFAVSNTIFEPTASAFLSDRVAFDRQGSTLGLLSVVEDVGIMSGRAVGGILWEAQGSQFPFLLGGASSGLGFMIWGLFHRLWRANPRERNH